MAFNLPKGVTPDALILWLLDLGITLSEQDQTKIRANVIADAAESDRVTDENRARDEDARRKLAGDSD